MLSLEEIVCMKITESAPKMATMVISGHTVLALMKWGQ